MNKYEKQMADLADQINLNTERYNKINKLLEETRNFTVQLQLDLIRARLKERDIKRT